MELSALGKWLMGAGILLVLLGLACLVAPKVPFIGKLPGDIFIKRENFSFYFPLMTCLVVSLLLTLLWSFFNKK